MKREDKVATKKTLAWTVIGAALLAGACGSGSSNPIDAAGTPDAMMSDAGPPDAVPGSPPLAVVVATAVDFGLADCGGAAAADQVVTLTNGGGTTLNWSATIRFTPAFHVTGTNGGQLAPGDSVDITIAANAVAASAAAGQQLNDVLLIAHNDTSRGPIELPVSLQAQGATLTLSPSSADFGLIPVGAAAPAIPLTITNTGNAPVDVALSSPDAGGLATTFAGGPAAVTLAPGATLTDAAATFTPTGTAATTATAALSVTGAVCGASATGVTLKGQGTAAQALVSPATVDFGQTSCGEQAAPHVFFVANTGNQAFSWAATLDAGIDSHYTVVPTSGTVGAGSSQTVTVFTEGVPSIADTAPNGFGETLTVTTSAAGDVPRTINLDQTAGGATIVFESDSVQMATPLYLSNAVSNATGTLTVRNDGNQTAALSIISSGGGDYRVAGGSVDLAPGSSTDVSVVFYGGAIGTSTATLTSAVAGTSCALPDTAIATGETQIAEPGQGPAKEAMFTNDLARRRNQSTLCARTFSGHVLCLGDNGAGARGAGNVSVGQQTPNMVVTETGVLDHVVALNPGRDWFCATRDDDTEWCWGNIPATLVTNHGGATGGTGTLRFATERFADLHGVNGGGPFGCGVSAAGAMSCFVNNSRANGQETGYVVDQAATVAVHSYGGYALRTDGSVVSFGANSAGERGDNVASNAPPGAIPGLTGVLQVSAGGGGSFNRGSSRHGCALKDDGTVWCWGRGGRSDHGNRLGNGDPNASNQTTPVQVMLDSVTPLTGATAISSGREFSCALTDTNVFCWGRGSEGQIGDGTGANAFYATGVAPTLTGVTALRSSDRQTCATLTNGAARCWGSFTWGTFFSPTAIDAFEPPPVP